MGLRRQGAVRDSRCRTTHIEMDSEDGQAGKVRLKGLAHRALLGEGETGVSNEQGARMEQGKCRGMREGGPGLPGAAKRAQLCALASPAAQLH